MTSDRVITHIRMMAAHDPSYAEKALVWYCKALPWLELPSFGEVVG